MSDYVGVIDESQRAWASAFLASAAREKIFGAAVNRGGISTGPSTAEAPVTIAPSDEDDGVKNWPG